MNLEELLSRMRSDPCFAHVVVLEEEIDPILHQTDYMKAKQEKSRIGRCTAMWQDVCICHPTWREAHGLTALGQAILAATLREWMKQPSAPATKKDLGELWLFAQKYPWYEYWTGNQTGSQLPKNWE